MFGAHATIPIGPAPPPWITKWLDASFYVKFSGKATFKGKLSRNEYGVIAGSIPMKGTVSGALGATVLVFKPKILKFDANGGTGIAASGNAVANSTGVYVEGAKVDWDGIKAKVNIEAVWGLIEVDREWELAESKTILGPATFTLFP